MQLDKIQSEIARNTAAEKTTKPRSKQPLSLIEYDWEKSNRAEYNLEKQKTQQLEKSPKDLVDCDR